MCGRAGRDTDRGVVISLQPTEFRDNYAEEYKKTVFPDLSDWLVFKLQRIEDTQSVSIEDFWGLGFDNDLDLQYAMKVMFLSTGLINNKRFAVLKAKKITNLAAHCRMDYKRAFSLIFCKGIDSPVAAKFICSFESLLQGSPIVGSLVSTKVKSSSTHEKKRRKNERNAINDMIACTPNSQFGGEIYNMIKLLDKLERSLREGNVINHVLYDITSVKQCLRRRKALFKIWKNFEGSDACGEFQQFFKLYANRTRTRLVNLFLIQMAVAVSHTLQLCYVEYDDEKKDGDAEFEKIYIWHSGHRVYVDKTKLSWPQDDSSAFEDIFDHTLCKERARKYFIFNRSITDWSGKVIVSNILCVYHCVGCYATKKYVRRVGKKEIAQIREDSENDFHTTTTIYNSYNDEKGAFFDYSKFLNNSAN